MTANATVECENCGASHNSQSYCGECGAGPDPWTENVEYDWERDVDLPVVFSVYEHDDTYQKWKAFAEQVFGERISEVEIANLPNDVPQMKYTDFQQWYVMTEELEVKGPFDREVAARAVSS
jgi:hypothetical protein